MDRHGFSHRKTTYIWNLLVTLSKSKDDTPPFLLWKLWPSEYQKSKDPPQQVKEKKEVMFLLFFKKRLFWSVTLPSSETSVEIAGITPGFHQCPKHWSTTVTGALSSQIRWIYKAALVSKQGGASLQQLLLPDPQLCCYLVKATEVTPISICGKPLSHRPSGAFCTEHITLKNWNSSTKRWDETFQIWFYRNIVNW